MERRTFWTRVGNWFRPVPAHATSDGTLPETGSDGLRKPVTTRSNGNGSRGLFARSVRERGGFWRREGSGLAVSAELLESVARHLEVQDGRSKQVADSVSQLARTVAELPGLARAQQERLASVAQRVESAAAVLKGWSPAIEKLPGLADAQREALCAVSRQVEAGRETHERMVHSTDAFTGAVRSLERAYVDSVGVMQNIQQSAAERESRLAVMAERDRRLTRVMIGTCALAALSGAVMVSLAMIR